MRVYVNGYRLWFPWRDSLHAGSSLDVLMDTFMERSRLLDSRWHLFEVNMHRELLSDVQAIRYPPPMSVYILHLTQNSRKKIPMWNIFGGATCFCGSVCGWIWVWHCALSLDSGTRKNCVSRKTCIYVRDAVPRLSRMSRHASCRRAPGSDFPSNLCVPFLRKWFVLLSRMYFICSSVGNYYLRP